LSYCLEAVAFTDIVVGNDEMPGRCYVRASLAWMDFVNGLRIRHAPAFVLNGELAQMGLAEAAIGDGGYVIRRADRCVE